MSHIVEIRTTVKDPIAIRGACQRLNLPAPRHDTASLFSSQATGWVVELRDWRYPIVCEVQTGTIKFDNYDGAWGDEARLNEFVQGYAVAKTRLEAAKEGYSVSEQQRADGSIKLRLSQGA